MTGNRIKKVDRPIIIAGPERTGTTLLYSLLANSDLFYWFSRIDSILYGFPMLAEGCRRFLNLFDRQTYIARSGKISRMEGFNTPSECVPYWRDYFETGDENDYLVDNDRFTSEDVTEAKKQEILDDLGKRLYYSGKERILLKQPGFSLKLNYWDRIFDDARFLICVRDLDSNIESLVKVKKKSQEHFWGTKVPGWRNYLKADAYTQSLFQLKEIYRIMTDSLKEREIERRLMIVSYDALTADPKPLLREITEFCEIPWSQTLETGLEGIVRKRKNERFLYDAFDSPVQILEKLRRDADEKFADPEPNTA